VDNVLAAALLRFRCLHYLQMDMPTGRRIAAKVTIHAGKYAGAVVGRSAWTYE